MTSEERKEVAAKLGEAFLRQQKLALQLNEVNALCAKLANELEKPEE